MKTVHLVRLGAEDEANAVIVFTANWNYQRTTSIEAARIEYEAVRVELVET